MINHTFLNLVFFFGLHIYYAKSSTEPKSHINSTSITQHSPKKASIMTAQNIFFDKSCQSDMIIFCSRPDNSSLTDLEALKCLHERVKSFTFLSKKCQHIVYTTKMNLTSALQNDTTFTKEMNVCQNDMNLIQNCQRKTNSSLITCLLDTRDQITTNECKELSYDLSILVFSDYRFLELFHRDCTKDIELFKCGRLEKHVLKLNKMDPKKTKFDPKNDTIPPDNTGQGETIECLSLLYDELEPTCQKQIMRVTELQSEDYHLDRSFYFACREDRERFCENVKSGGGRIYKCLSENNFQKTMSDACKKQIFRRHSITKWNINTDRAFTKACRKDLEDNNCFNKNLYSGESSSLDPQFFLSNILLCLDKANKEGIKLAEECHEEMVSYRKMLMSDYRLSPSILEYCIEDIVDRCDNGIQKDGKTLRCLMSEAKKAKMNNDTSFDTDCYNELDKFLLVVGVTEDLRMDPVLYTDCQNVIESSCANITPGYGGLIKCLLNQISSYDMRSSCHDRLIDIDFFMARDWKLNRKLYSLCKADAIRFCNSDPDWFGTKGESKEFMANTLPCLFTHIRSDNATIGEFNLKPVSEPCEIEIREAMKMRANTMDLLPNSQIECRTELRKLCSLPVNATYRKGFELECLLLRWNDLGMGCQKSIGDLSMIQRKDIRLDSKLFDSCLPLSKSECVYKQDLSLDCLIKLKHNHRVSKKCSFNIEQHQILKMKTISTNSRFEHFCNTEIAQYCPERKSLIEALYCLSEVVLKDQTSMGSMHTLSIRPLCQSEMRADLLEVKEDIHLDPVLNSTCGMDVSKFCSELESGKGRIYECLRQHQDKLSDGCKGILFERRRIEKADDSTDYFLRTNCVWAINKYCSRDNKMETAAKGILQCLRKNFNKDLGSECREIIVERIISQNKDVRFNEKLWEACKSDVTEKCDLTFLRGNDSTPTANSAAKDHSEILRCLEKFAIHNHLTLICQEETKKLMLEAAIVDYRLDPNLAQECFQQINTYCKNDTNQNKLNCLKIQFQKGWIIYNTTCYNEVKRSILEGASDIFVDKPDRSYVFGLAFAVFFLLFFMGTKFRPGFIFRCCLNIFTRRPHNFTELK